MQNNNKKIKKRRLLPLPVKIILLLTAILIVVTGILRIILGILWANNIQIIYDVEDASNWLFFFSLIIGTTIMVLFGVAIHLAVVVRIRRLNNATKEVAKGNFDVSVKVKGSKDELSELTENFNSMSLELKANEYLSKDFVRNVSHEFKTPISVIRAYGELIEAEAKAKAVDKNALLEYAAVITTQSDRLTAITKSMLQLSLLESTTIIKKENKFKPGGQIQEILQLMQTKYSDKAISLDLQLSDKAVTNNEQLLYQVWQNLISNAVKFSLDGGIIKIVLDINDNELYFSITDNGIGIKHEDKEKVFSHFFMADSSRSTEGSGLGLSIVKRIVDKLGGNILFESIEDNGTTFSVIL